MPEDTSLPPLDAAIIASNPATKTFVVAIERGFGLRMQFIVDDLEYAKQICTAINNPPEGVPQ